ncbi:MULTISPECIES: GNAT family N-acetyltransferase [unclassified Paenibacillus]|uniref:GNAT family N-acetyltransferase n=1 Tax=unclassified Paenibacillus TaxID=185978 RepID=UPI0008967651|nr:MULTISPECIES: GNAT family N-acetyltransferase [unclassified Paenibacillus]SEB25730.1 Acetyltransferase (GNAT) domain-containing protein [Paenibacillus sp. 276b]SLK08227.1 Acetyltransferase (GNAT) domain-containing protein [Paenibacillus sp. RU5A]SOC70967.1 Acetyltransferase (GNAT) domain-containing protein [Paenibacillus sp. RU26A]SOC73431.1 Acetyltransferase (GNAT) domain-containing protein [Paenibacillus sp. RU5M]
MDQINIEHTPPSAAEYLALRKSAGLSAMSNEGAEIGLPNSLFAVCLREENEIVGMGRVIGDGGCFFQVVDIAVRPDQQGRGYGKLIMSEIMNYLREHVPARGLVSLLADVPADRLYAQFGFTYTSPKSEGMWWRQGE